MVKIEYTSTGGMEEYFNEMMLVLEALEEVQEGWSESLLTDESAVADFLMDKKELKVFFDSLGIKGKESDTILSLCKKLRTANKKK
tara:strand:- start:10299 stop:10556 length:258 start_codon:yes stop_codon:yes gene_type:complete